MSTAEHILVQRYGGGILDGKRAWQKEAAPTIRFTRNPEKRSGYCPFSMRNG